MTQNFPDNALYEMDNLSVLRGMNSETVDLIATDPPFNIKRNRSGTAGHYVDKRNPTMKKNKMFLFLLSALGFLIFCAHASQQGITEKLIAPTTAISSEKIRESVVLIEDKIGFGSGFFVERDKIATNIHVVAGPGQILVKSPDNETKWTVEGVAAYDVKNDLAILKVKEKGTPLPLANSDAVQSGDFFLAAGFPDDKYKDTIVTMVGNNQNGEKLIRLKSGFFPGNSFGPGYSGGPIVNRKGQVIGVCALGSEYYGYAVPSNILKVLLTRSKSTEPLDQWQKRAPIRAYPYYSQGRMKVNTEDYKEAINDFDKAIQLNPNLAIFYSGRGAAKYGLGNSEGAIADFEKGLKLVNGKSVETYFMLGTVKLTVGDYENAITHFDKAIGLTPKFVVAYHARAMAKLKLNDYESAIIDLDKTIEIDPTDANLYKSRAIIKVSLGESEAKQGKTKTARHLYKQAIEELTHAINIDPESHSFYGDRGWVKYNLAEFETLKGNIKKARKLYEAAINDCTKLIQQDPNNENVYITRCFAKIALEDFKGAIKDFDRLLQICSKSDKDYYYYQRGLAKKTLGNYKGAIADFDECIRLSPEDAAIAYYKRGLAKEALGQREAAKSDFEKAKELDPNVGQ